MRVQWNLRAANDRRASSPIIKSRHPHQIRTQDRIQLFVPNLRFLLLLGVFLHFRGIKSISCDKRAYLPRVFVLSVAGLFAFVKFVIYSLNIDRRR